MYVCTCAHLKFSHTPMNFIKPQEFSLLLSFIILWKFDLVLLENIVEDYYVRTSNQPTNSLNHRHKLFQIFYTHRAFFVDRGYT